MKNSVSQETLHGVSKLPLAGASVTQALPAMKKMSGWKLQSNEKNIAR